MAIRTIVRRTSTVLATAGTAAALTLGFTGSAAAIDSWHLQLCANGTYQTDFYFSGQVASVSPGNCATYSYQAQGGSDYVYVEAWVHNANPGVRAAAISVDVSKGEGVTTTGYYAGPSYYHVGYTHTT
jgi:hypothetical protein